MSSVLESGAKKMAENIADRAIDAIVDFAKDRYGKKQVKIGKDFKRYLENAVIRYNKVRTLATGTNPRSIIGEDDIYVDIGVMYKNKIISTEDIKPLLGISKNLIIQGTGGIGKSMLMRYLFIKTAYSGDYVPVLLELRKISNQTEGEISILELIYSSLQDFDVQLPRDQFEYSLRLGKYLFLFDGFDEVKESLAEETAAAIQAFSAKYPKNPCVITSRPKAQSNPLETFTTVESMTLDKRQAVLLASKIWPNDVKAKEFCRQLDEELYDKHKDFAENPLLLSMMFLTFMKNNSIPDHLSAFYQKSYEALYSAHDSNDKGVFKRDFACCKLNEDDFKLLFSRFCFITYFKEIYEFSESEMLSYLKDSISKLNLDNVNANDYLKDLRNAVCLIVLDGDVLKFSHRSFQAYFAAVYTASLQDEAQEKLFLDCLSKDIFWSKRDYYELTYQIEGEKFLINATEKKLRKLQDEVDNSDEPDIYLLNYLTNEIDLSYENEKDFSMSFYMNMSHCYEINALNLLKLCDKSNDYMPISSDDYNDYIILLRNYIKTLNEDLIVDKPTGLYKSGFSYEDIEKYLYDDREKIYSILIKIRGIEETRMNIRKWLEEIDNKRASLKTEDFIDNL